MFSAIRTEDTSTPAPQRGVVDRHDIRRLTFSARRGIGVELRGGREKERDDQYYNGIPKVSGNVTDT